MGERLIPKLDRLGAEAGIKQMTPETYKFAMLVRADVVAQWPERPWVGLTKEAIAEFDTWHDNREEEVGWVSPAEIVAYIDAKLREKNS